MLKVHIKMKSDVGSVVDRRISVILYVSGGVASLQFVAGSCACFPITHWGLCLELQKRSPLVQRSVTTIIVIITIDSGCAMCE